MWLWVAIGVVSFLALSAIVGLVIARTLGTIAREISELQEADAWSTLPPSRATADAPDQVPAESKHFVRASTR